MPPFRIKQRCCRPFFGVSYYKPQGVPVSKLDVNVLLLDELEAMHLCDFEDLSQAEAAQSMQISTTTLQSF